VLQEDSEGSDLYAVPVKRRQRKAEELPPGWEKHEVSLKKVPQNSRKSAFFLA
jgi:hypothetical protein